MENSNKAVVLLLASSVVSGCLLFWLATTHPIKFVGVIIVTAVLYWILFYPPELVKKVSKKFDALYHR